MVVVVVVAVFVIVQQKRKEMEAISNMHLEPERVHKVKIVMQLIFYRLVDYMHTVYIYFTARDFLAISTPWRLEAGVNESTNKHPIVFSVLTLGTRKGVQT